MQFLLLIYDQEKRWTTLEAAAQEADMGAWNAFGKEFELEILGGNALQPTPAAKTVRVREGKSLIMDGPFAETKEQLGGYYLIEAPDQDEALRIAAKIPWAAYGSIEVRPIITFS